MTDFDTWVAESGLPDDVKALMLEFRPGTEFHDVKGSDRRLYVTGIGEGKEGKEHAVMVSWTDPFTDYDKAIETQFPVPVSVLRANETRAKRMTN